MLKLLIITKILLTVSSYANPSCEVKLAFSNCVYLELAVIAQCFCTRFPPISDILMANIANSCIDNMHEMRNLQWYYGSLKILEPAHHHAE